MGTLSRMSRITKSVLTVLVLLGVALAPWGEVEVAPRHSTEMADG